MLPNLTHWAFKVTCDWYQNYVLVSWLNFGLVAAELVTVCAADVKLTPQTSQQLIRLLDTDRKLLLFLFDFARSLLLHVIIMVLKCHALTVFRLKSTKCNMQHSRDYFLLYPFLHPSHFPLISHSLWPFGTSTSDDKCLDWYAFPLSSLCKECFLAVTSHSLCPVLSSSLSHLSYHKYFFWKTICISVQNNQTSSESCTEKSVINVLAGPHCHYCLPQSQSINSRSLQPKKIFDNISHPLWSLLCHLRTTSLTFQHPLLPVSLRKNKKQLIAAKDWWFWIICQWSRLS